MDITRNWRLKTSRSHLLATRCPVTGTVMLPQQTGSAAARSSEVYVFELEAALPRVGADQLDYARAAR